MTERFSSRARAPPPHGPRRARDRRLPDLIDGLVLVQGLVVTRLLGPREIGLYGVVSTVVISLIALKRVGIDEAFVQQEEPDQEREFQHAFTLELGLSAGMALMILAAAPVVALVYRDDGCWR